MWYVLPHLPCFLSLLQLNNFYGVERLLTNSYLTSTEYFFNHMSFILCTTELWLRKWESVELLWSNLIVPEETGCNWVAFWHVQGQLNSVIELEATILHLKISSPHSVGLKNYGITPWQVTIVTIVPCAQASLGEALLNNFWPVILFYFLVIKNKIERSSYGYKESWREFFCNKQLFN